MTQVAELPQVSECSASACSYNDNNSCHAGAITISGDHAHCGTFVEISFRSGLERTAQVGACHRTECKHNTELVCGAASINVGAGDDVADCLTYSPR